MKKIVLIILFLTSIFLWGQDRFVLAGGYGTADVDSFEHEIYTFRLAGKNQSTFIGIDYDLLIYEDDFIESEYSEKLTSSSIHEISFLFGKSMPFGRYSSVNFNGGISVIRKLEKFEQSNLPEKKRKDFGFPIDATIDIGIFKNLGVSFRAKKSYNDIAPYFGYSAMLQFIF